MEHMPQEVPPVNMNGAAVPSLEQSRPTMHGQALSLAKRGLAVFPLKPGEKAPATRHGFKDASDDPRKVGAWWQSWPEQNIGIATGKASNVWVLDVDGEKSEVSLASLVAEHSALPETVEAITGQGRHIYFRYVEGIGCTAGTIGPGLDTRGDGGYVVAPPSLHPSGRRYEWSVDCANGFAEAPAWLVDLARASKPAGIDGAVPIIPTADLSQPSLPQVPRQPSTCLDAGAQGRAP